jgi:predicted transcriptional regulator
VSFDVAAEAYEGFMGRYSRLLSVQLADLASVRAGQRVLDAGRHWPHAEIDPR